MLGCIRMLVHLIYRSMDAATFKFVKTLADSQSIDASNAVQLGVKRLLSIEGVGIVLLSR